MAAIATIAPSAASALPPPGLGRSVNVAPVSGAVLLKQPGARRYVRLRRARQVPVGAVLDARRGGVRISASSGIARRRYSGVFSGGAFSVRQERRRRAIVELRLRGGRFGACAARGAGARSAARRRIRRLRGRARGRFRTRGRYSAATVRGTTWTVEDLCQGTRTDVDSGRVQVSNLGPQVTLARGESFVTYCSATGDFCTSVEQESGGVLLRIGGFPFRGDYRLCVTSPAGAVDCRVFPFRLVEPRAFEIYASDVSWRRFFPSRGQGEYIVRWDIGDSQLGPDLFFTVR